MTLEQFIIQLVLPLSTGGVIGYFTYFVLNRMGVPFFVNDKKDDKKNWWVFFGVIDVLIVYALYFYTNSNYFVAIGAGICIAFVMALIIYPGLFRLLFKYVNKRRRKNGFSAFSGDSNVWNSVTNKDYGMAAFVYDLKTDHLLIYGDLSISDGDSEMMDFVLVPNPKLKPWQFKEAMEHAFVNKGTKYYVNADKELKIVFIPGPKYHE